MGLRHDPTGTVGATEPGGIETSEKPGHRAVVLGLDGSDQALRAVRWATAEARRCRGRCGW
jgi:hypothetical protein